LANSKEERERNKKVLLATLNYLLQYHSGDMVFDDYSPSKQWYLSEIKQTKIDIAKYRSKQIRRRLDMHISLLRQRYDLGLNEFIRENTGYDIDIYEQFKANAMPIILKGSIVYNDVYQIERYLKAYEMVPEEQKNVQLLKVLLERYEDGLSSLLVDDDFVTVEGCIVVQGKNIRTMNPADYDKFRQESLLCEETAPNRSYKISIETTGKGQHASTYANISLSGIVGGVYGAKGEKLPIKAHWKDDHNVIIETKEHYEIIFKYKQVTSYGKVVNIEYRFT
jgi:hypothetical protein